MDAQEILRQERARGVQRENTYNYAATKAAFRKQNAAFRKQKAALTRAVNSGVPDRVVLACHNAVREWGAAPFNGHWPDDWARWQCALDDALPWHASVRLRDL